jgi:hypothetical protein
MLNARKWQIPKYDGFTEIDSGSSIQLHNETENKTVYLSILTATDKSGGPKELTTEVDVPELVTDKEGFHLQGRKIRGNEALVVVITFGKKTDEAWARNFFDEIK